MERGRIGCTLACAVLALAGCKADLKCGPLEVDEERRLCVCPNGGTHMDGLCILDDGSVTPLDAGASDAGGDHGDAGPVDAGAVDPGPVDAGTFDAGMLDACVAAGEERCDGVIDEDCDGTVDEGCECTSGAEMPCGTSDVGACSRGTQRCVEGAWAACEGAVEPAVETCNDIDDDCDGDVDEEVATSTYYRDADGDTYGSDADTRIACRAPSGYVARGGDCVDSNATVHPGQTEYFTVPISGAPAGREFDYDCDGEQARAFTRRTFGCREIHGGCVGGDGFWQNPLNPDLTPLPACGETALYTTGCEVSECVAIEEPRTQSCR